MVLHGLFEVPEDASLFRCLSRCLGAELFFLACWPGALVFLSALVLVIQGTSALLLTVSLGLVGVSACMNLRFLWRMPWVLREALSSLEDAGPFTWTSPACLSMLRMLTGLLVVGGADAAWNTLVVYGPVLPANTAGIGLLALGALFIAVTGLFSEWAAKRLGWRF